MNGPLYNIGSMMIIGWSLWWYDGKNALAVNKLQSLWSWFSLNSYVLAVHIFFLFEFPPFQQFHENFECLSETNVASAILRRIDWLRFCCVQILSATSNHSEYLSYIQIAEIQRHNFLLAPTGALIVTLCYYTYVQLFQIFTQSIDAIHVTSVTLSRLNSINAIDVTSC